MTKSNDISTNVDEAERSNNEHEPALVISPAIKNAYQSLLGKNVATRSTAAIRAMVAFSMIRLPYPRQLEAMLTFHEAQQLAKSMKGHRQNAICLFAQAHTGKSTVAEHFTEIANESAPEGCKPVTYIAFGSGGGPLQMYRAILKANGEGFPATKDLEILRERAGEVMKNAGTEIVVIDETHEGAKGSIYGPSLTSELKTLLNDGIVGIVLLGTEKAEELIAKDKEFLMRTMAPCRLDALNWADDEDRELWIGFLAALDDEMVRLRLVSEPTGFAEEELASALCNACDGVIGQLMKVVLHALRIAIHDDRTFIVLEDIAAAVDDWSLKLNLVDCNPIDFLLQDAA